MINKTIFKYLNDSNNTYVNALTKVLKAIDKGLKVIIFSVNNSAHGGVLMYKIEGQEALQLTKKKVCMFDLVAYQLDNMLIGQHTSEYSFYKTKIKNGGLLMSFQIGA